jgi:predicted outer membrane protein
LLAAIAFAALPCARAADETPADKPESSAAPVAEANPTGVEAQSEHVTSLKKHDLER